MTKQQKNRQSIIQNEIDEDDISTDEEGSVRNVTDDDNVTTRISLMEKTWRTSAVDETRSSAIPG